MAPGPGAEDFDPILVGIQAFFQIGPLALAVGVVVLAQGAINDEKQSGTAAWVLSKPVSRAAFVLSKLAAHAAGVLVLLVGLQSAVAYGLLSLKLGAPFPVTGFAVGVLGLALHSLFYLALTLMLGVLSDSRGVVLGVSLGSLLGGQILAGVVQQLAMGTPWVMAGVLPAVAAGQEVPLWMIWLPMAATAVWCVAFVAAAVYRFERIEF
jgi:ABC-2 type transport system permease protein